MSNLTYLQDVGESRAERVTSDHPFPIKIPETPGVWQPPVAGQGVHRFVQVPGIGAAAAYASGDAFGGLIKFPGVFRAGKNSGWITGIYLFVLPHQAKRRARKRSGAGKPGSVADPGPR